MPVNVNQYRRATEMFNIRNVLLLQKKKKSFYVTETDSVRKM